MRKAILAVVAACGAGCASAPPSSSEALVDLFNHHLRERAALDPVWATRQGLHDYDDRLTRYDDASHASRRDLTRRTLEKLRRIDADALPPQERVDHRLFLAELEIDDFDYERRDFRTDTPDIPVGTISAVHELLIKDFAPKERRAACAVARLRQIGLVCDDVRKTLQRPPKLWTGMAIDDLEGTFAFLDEVGSLTGPTPGLEEAVKSARSALNGYLEFLKSEVLPRSDGSFVYGRMAYDLRLRRGHLLSIDSAALAAIGRREFGRTLVALEESAKRIDPVRDWKSILDEMMGVHPSQEQLLGAYREEAARARQFMIDHDIVGLPEEKLEIIETPPFLRSSVPFAAYLMPAPLDSSRLGHFYVTPDPEAHVVSDIPGTTWHEAYPGHHLQFVYAKDVASPVRRLNSSPLLSEGWGFYCEELAHESGYYDDPRERLMQLNWRLQRAARIILDVSLHTGEMSFDDAVIFLVEKVRMGKPQAVASVSAYTQSPTYFACYMVGMLEIVRIRERFRSALGPRFSLREFHERLLRCGNVPPALIEAELERTWLAGTPR